MEPWGAGGGPSKEELQQMVDDGWTDAEIGATRGASRQMAFKWRKKHDVKRPFKKKLNHDDVFPWEVKTEHYYTQEARALTLVSRHRQGAVLAPDQLKRMEAFIASLNAAGVVLDYDRDRGFFPVRRVISDAPDAVIRKPVT